MKTNVGLMRLTEAVFASMPSMGNLMIMILFAQLLFVLFGMQIFGDSVEGGPDGLRSSFNSFWQSNLTLFQCLSGENWTDVLYGYMVPYPAVSPIFFIAWTVCGNYVLLNLFVAVITENIEMDDSETGIKQILRHQAERAAERMVDAQPVMMQPIFEEDSEVPWPLELINK